MNRLLHVALVIISGMALALTVVATLSRPVAASRPAAPALTATNTPTGTPTQTPTNTPTGTPTGTPTNTPTSTPTDVPTTTPAATSELSATLRIAADLPVVEVGQTLALTVDLDVSGDCTFGVMDLTVMEEDGPGEPFFAHIDPAFDTIGPPHFPSRWTFRALRPGAARFSAYAFGEGNCDGSWFWHSELAWSDVVQVLPSGERPYRVWLPTVSR